MERSAFADVSAYQLKSPGSFSGPKSKIQIEIYSPFCFVTDSLTMLSAELLKPLSWSKQQKLYGPVMLIAHVRYVETRI